MLSAWARRRYAHWLAVHVQCVYNVCLSSLLVFCALRGGHCHPYDWLPEFLRQADNGRVEREL